MPGSRNVRSHQQMEAALNLAFRQGAYSLVHDAPFLKKIECRDTADTVVCRGTRVLVHIDDSELCPARVPDCQFIQNRCQSLAVSSPWGGEFEDNRPRVREYLGAEVPIGNGGKPAREEI
jgi:hypothetical protein